MKLTLDNDQKLAQELEGLIPTIRSRHKVVIEEWLKIHQAWKGVYNRSFFKSEIFNHYVPYFRRAVERFTVRGTQMVLPTNEFFEVFPADEFDDEAGKQADSVMQYLLYLFRTKIKTYSLVKQLFRTRGLYGRTILKTGVKVVTEDGKDRVWPTARVVDPFMFTMWPETVSNVDDAQIVMEDAVVSWAQYQDDVLAKRATEINQDDLTEPRWDDTIQRRLSDVGISTPPSNQPRDTDDTKPSTRVTWVHRSEVWFKAEGGWHFVWVVWNLKGGTKVVRKSTVKFARPQYRVSIDRELPGEQYTTSMGNDQEPLQVLLNDQVNMLLEGQAMEFSPPAAIDSNLVTRAQSLVYRPRAKWLVPPEGVKWMEMKTPNRSAFQGIQWTMGMMDTFSGSSPMAEGQPIRNMPRAGFAVSSLLSMSLADIRDAARAIEEDILTPMLQDLHALTVQFVPESQIMRIPRTQNFNGANMSVKDLEGNYSFNWVGSLQTQDNQDRANRLMSVFGSVTKAGPVLQQDLQARGYRINYSAILKRLWRDGVGERGADSIIEKIEPGEPQVDFSQPGASSTLGGGPDLAQLIREFQSAGGGQ